MNNQTLHSRTYNKVRLKTNENVLMLAKSKCYEVSSTTVKLRSSALGLIRGRQISPNYIRN